MRPSSQWRSQFEKLAVYDLVSLIVVVVVVVVAFGISDLAAAEWSSCSNQLGWSSRLDAGARARGLMAI